MARRDRFSLTGIDAVPPGKSTALNDKAHTGAGGRSVAERSSAREQSVLVGPIERQIEFGETRRRKLDGLPTVQDRLDYLGLQESEVDETPLPRELPSPVTNTFVGKSPPPPARARSL